MEPLTIILVFAISFVLVFLPVLSIGVEEQHKSGNVVPGTEQGAPVDPMLKKKVIWASIGAGVITLIAFIVITVLAP